MKHELCPCGSQIEVSMCCQQFHTGNIAPNAVALMRSRYTAYVLKNAPYLLATWHSTTRPSSIEFDDQLNWLGLKIVSNCETGADIAQVEFIARYRVGGQSAARLHERSRFVREHGRWLYVNGEFVSAA